MGREYLKEMAETKMGGLLIHAWLVSKKGISPPRR